MNDIVIKDLRKSFADKSVLNGLNLTIPNGKAVCIMGGSGCGKTTLINILLGFEAPDSGTIQGFPPKASVVFQEDRLCEDFSALSNVKMVLSGNSDKAIDILKSLGLGEAINKPVKKLSGGMKRRVAIARALAAEAEIVIMDEPFKGLDEDTKNSVMAYVREALTDKTFIIVTHEPEEAEFMGATVYKMVNGVISA